MSVRTTPRARVGAPLVAGAVLLAYCAGWLVIGTLHVWRAPVLGWVPLPVMLLLAANACRRAAARGDVAVPTRRFWRQVGVCMAALVPAVLSNTVDAVGSGRPSQHLSPHTLGLYLGVVSLVTWPLLRLPNRQRSRGEWARFGLDAGVVLITSGVLIWHFTVRRLDAWTSQTGSGLSVLAVTMVGVFSLIIFVKVAFAGTALIDRRALQVLSAGTAVATGTGALSPLFITWPYLSTSVVAIAVAAYAVQLSATRQAHSRPEQPAAATTARYTGMLPYAAVAVIDALLIAGAVLHNDDVLVVVCSAVAVSALVVIRQITALRENRTLLTTVDANLAELRRYQAQLDHQVSHDALTDIANRATFEERVTVELAAGAGLHVVLLDLDDFKDVNDRLGHGVGDAMLKAVSRRLHEQIRDTDLVARLGGDEFALLLPGVSTGEADAVLARILAAVQRPLPVAGHDMVSRISVGVTASVAGDCPGELLRRADVAMYAAKAAGGGRWTWFDPEMDRIAAAQARLGADLRQAIVRDELFVLYQPIVELPHGRLAGAEALVRWRHPEHGLVSPAVFIPLAERNGFIVELGRWVLEQVVEQAAAWQREHGPAAPPRISVNVSARQLHEPGFAAEVAALLARSGLEPDRLTAEVTETAVLGTGAALDAVRQLHELGLRVALDDFGTGQSSLSLLVSTPVSVLKVDKSFVDGVTAGSTQAVIVDGLIGITEGLRIQAVAEGVETEAQARRLHAAGYRYAQGFHFARPMTGGELARLLVPAADPVAAHN